MTLETQLDLLIDGELPEEQRATVFQQLDQTPDGWKQCALGFLEAQSWSQAMVHSPPIAIETLTQKKRPWIRALSTATAAVLGFLASLLMTEEPETLAPETVVEYLPVPIEKGLDLTPTSTDTGQLYYSTRKEIPNVLLQAFLQAGHEVEQIQHTYDLPRKSAPPLKLPLTETRILINQQL